MKSKIATLLFLIGALCALNCNADGPVTHPSDESHSSIKYIYRNIYGEVFGPSGWISAYYEQRFYPGCKFGFRVGIGYSEPTDHPGSAGKQVETDLFGVIAPLGLNFITGRDRHKFEAGVNFSPGFFRYHRVDRGKTVYAKYPGGASLQPSWQKREGTTFNMNCAINIGYRYQLPAGFMFRIGWAPALIGIGRYHCISIESWYPYISFGYTFK